MKKIRNWFKKNEGTIIEQVFVFTAAAAIMVEFLSQ